MTSSSTLHKRVRGILRALGKAYPDAHCALHHANPLQLLIATILSAQCTDTRVNRVTPALFRRYPDTQAFASADPRELEQLIRSTGFFRNKTQNIVRLCQLLQEKHGGRVPASMEELVSLPGVGRKTANVILGNAFHVPGITVDTHVGRVSRRLGLTSQTDPAKVERDLMAVLPKQEWTQVSHRLIFHGRRVCHARKPRCAECLLASLCPRIGVEATTRSGAPRP
jgi:endonuclease-3